MVIGGKTRFAGDLVEHARAFVALSVELEAPGAGAFERAARRLHLDTSVLRRRLAALSEHAGGVLVTGRGRDLRLTPLGLRTRTLASELLDRADAIRTHEGPPERVVIGCTGAISSDLLPPVLAAELARSTTLTVALRRLGTEACIAKLLAGDVDLGVVRGPSTDPRWPRELDAALLGRDRLWVGVSARHPLAHTRTVRLRDIARLPLILYGPSSATRARVIKKLAPLGGRVALEVEGRAPALAYARMGVGVAFISALAHAQPRAPGVHMRDVTHLFEAAAFWLLTPRAKSPRVAELLEALLGYKGNRHVGS
jgi:DNA-binding transcriptional LysR family regulator